MLPAQVCGASAVAAAPRPASVPSACQRRPLKVALPALRCGLLRPAGALPALPPGAQLVTLPLRGAQRLAARPGAAPVVTAAAAATTADFSAPIPQPVSFAWPGVKPLPLLLSVGLGLALRFLVAPPLGVTMQAWALLSIFVSTIAGLVLTPLPVGAWAFLGVTVAVATKTLTFAQAFKAFTDDSIWLIVVAFFFARGFEKTGLGERVATLFVKMFGKSTLGLAYGLNIAEALIAPAMPSTTARAGGIFMPIISSLAKSAGSLPGDDSRKKLGAFLVQSQLQGASNSSNLFLTAAAQNLLCMKIATEMGWAVPSAWVTWFKAALVPALLGLLLTPIVLYKVYPPQIKDTPDAPKQADERLAKMGPMSRDECIMLGTMGAAVLLWVCGDKLGLSAVTTAMMGLCALLLTGVLQWKDCLQYSAAWDTLTWFAVLVGMSGQLNSMGVITHFASTASTALVAANLSWKAVFVLLNVVYFALHYMFAAQTAHVGALYPAVFTMMLSAGVPPVIAALSLAFMSSYISLPELFEFGALMAVINLVLWFVAGSVWWRFLGLF